MRNRIDQSSLDAISSSSEFDQQKPNEPPVIPFTTTHDIWAITS